MAAPEGVFNALIAEVKARFPDVLFGFEGKLFGDAGELWVYVLRNMDRFKEVDDFCKNLASRRTDPQFPVSILAKTWTGPWPGGQSEEELRKRREEFKRRMAGAGSVGG